MLLNQICSKYQSAKKRSVSVIQIRKDLLTLEDIDIEPALDALQEFEDIIRGDYNDYEEYKEDKENAWDNFLDTLYDLQPETYIKYTE